MQSYVVTFYRGAGEECPDRIVGTFQNAAGGAEQPFRGLAELHRLVDEAGAAWGRTKKHPRPRAAMGGCRQLEKDLSGSTP